jgi:hypothetical protein
MVRTLALILPLACSFALPLAAQDSENTSVAEAARRSREQKKASTKPAPIITDDTLTPAPTPAAATNAPTGQQSAVTAEGAAAPAGSNTPDQNAPSAADEAEQKKKDVEALKQEVAALQGEVDLAQRSLVLDQDAFYSKPDFSNDKDGKVKLDAEQADLKQKQDDLAQLKAKLAGLGVAEEPNKTPAPPAKP